MARKKKNTVNYFPHLIDGGKTMFIIESKYKNDGYATWYKILERLGKSEKHFIDLSDNKELEYLASKCNIDNNLLGNIIKDLVDLGQFDKYLWDTHNVLWNQDFINNIEDVYKRRNEDLPTIKLICQHLEIKYKQNKLNVDKGTHSKVKYIKVKERIVKYIKEKKIICPFESENFINAFILWCNYRIEIKKPVDDGEISLQGQLKTIARVSNGKESEAIRIIHNCIEKKWVGIQDHNTQKNDKQTSANQADIDALIDREYGRNN